MLSDVPIKPDSHNLFLLGTSDHVYSEVKLTIYPGSGVVSIRIRYIAHTMNSCDSIHRHVSGVMVMLCLHGDQTCIQPILHQPRMVQESFVGLISSIPIIPISYWITPKARKFTYICFLPCFITHFLFSEDGWETPHSRTNPRNDFIVVQLATPGILNHVVVSTEHFIGMLHFKLSSKI